MGDILFPVSSGLNPNSFDQEDIQAEDPNG
jgi:hypothetical protein